MQQRPKALSSLFFCMLSWQTSVVLFSHMVGQGESFSVPASSSGGAEVIAGSGESVLPEGPKSWSKVPFESVQDGAQKARSERSWAATTSHTGLDSEETKTTCSKLNLYLIKLVCPLRFCQRRRQDRSKRDRVFKRVMKTNWKQCRNNVMPVQLNYSSFRYHRQLGNSLAVFSCWGNVVLSVCVFGF